MASKSLAIFCLSVALAGCGLGSIEQRSQYPADDFHLELEYRVHNGVHPQVRRTASIDHEGLVIVKEADVSLRSPEHGLTLPVFRRVCAYRLHWRSMRWLARRLAESRPAEIPQPDHPAGDRVSEEVEFRLVYDRNEARLLLRDRVYGEMTAVLRLTNAFLPPPAEFVLPEMSGETEPVQVQDVPPITDSLTGALRFHREQLAERGEDHALLRDTFALACATGEKAVAESCLRAMVDLREADRAGFRRVLAASPAGGN